MNEKIKKRLYKHKDFNIENNCLNLLCAFDFSCNYKCSYCFARKENKSMTKENLNKLIDFIKNHTKNNFIDISITGGEPLLYKHLKYFISSILEKEENSKNIELILLTNFSKINQDFIDFVNNFKDKNFTIIFSIHPEYINNEYIKHLHYCIENIKINKEISVITGNKFFDRIEYFLDTFLNLNLENKKYIRLQEIRYKNTSSNKDLPKTILERFKDKEIKEKKDYIFKNKKYTYSEIFNYFKKKYNFNFKNKVLCYAHDYKIFPDFEIEHHCTHKKIKFEDLKKIDFKKPFLCPMEKCDFSCYRESPRIFFKD